MGNPPIKSAGVAPKAAPKTDAPHAAPPTQPELHPMPAAPADVAKPAMTAPAPDAAK
jgi:hypothetical protein